MASAYPKQGSALSLVYLLKPVPSAPRLRDIAVGRECSHFIDEKGEAQRESVLRSVPPQTLLLGFSSLLGEVQEEVLAWWEH